MLPAFNRLARSAALLGVVALTSLVPGAAPAAAQVLDRDPPTSFYEGSLPFFYDLYTFRGDGGGTALVASFAVPAGELKGRGRNGNVLYRFDVTLVLVDTILQTVARRDDSVYVAASRSLPDDHLLYTHVELPAEPNRNTVHRVVMTDAGTPGAGQLYEGPYAIPDYSGTALMLSDIALGEPAKRGGWRRGNVRLALLPTSQFPGSSFDVYYEIYNLPYGRPYTTQVTVEPLGRDGRSPRPEDAMGLRFEGEADTRPDGSVRELRRVDAALEDGWYRLTVEVTDRETEETARRSRLFRVRGWLPGTTLVPARPR